MRKAPRRLLRRPPSATVRGAVCQAMATWGRDLAPSSMLVVCSRVGDAGHVPRGYLTADCDQCKNAVWLNPDVHAIAERLGMPIVATCTRCLKADDGGH